MKAKAWLSVKELSNVIENSLNVAELTDAVVFAEILDIKFHSSGHIYLTLSDKNSMNIPPQERAVIKCTLWRSTFQRMNLSFSPRQGMEVVVSGSVRVYQPRGEYNFNIQSMEQLGIGALLQKIEKTRQMLIEEGLIDPSVKKPLPLVPTHLGVITAEGSAALQDILKQVRERFAQLRVTIIPAIMQGDKGVPSIVQALQDAPKLGVDVLLLSRGGGSFEDLMLFQDESLCRAIFHCPIPVVSAIGHQTDAPLVDFVADKAASTPTDGAKLIVPEKEKILASLSGAADILAAYLKRKLEFESKRLLGITTRRIWETPDAIFQNRRMVLQEYDQRVQTAFIEQLQKGKERLGKVPDLLALFQKVLDKARENLNLQTERLMAFSPLATLSRGYSLAYKNNKLLRTVKSVNKGDLLKIRMSDGILNVKHESTENI